MQELSERYAEELSAQFRTLNHFVKHAGEIGRVHETYLRNIIGRFLPGKLGIGTGFVVSKKWQSAQQDIIVFNQQDYPILFQVGDCVVVDDSAVAALLEVKTTLTSINDFGESLNKLDFLYNQANNRYFIGLFAWEGLLVDSALSVIWEYVRKDPLKNLHKLPNAIYFRGQYLLLRNVDGRRETPPFRLLEINNNEQLEDTKKVTEGFALLTLINAMWEGGIQKHVRWPWWLNDWQKEIPQFQKPIPWPDDLQIIINDSLGK